MKRADEFASPRRHNGEVDRGKYGEYVNVKVARATPRGFEPLISTVTGWHVSPLHHGASLPKSLSATSSLVKSFVGLKVKCHHNVEGRIIP